MLFRSKIRSTSILCLSLDSRRSKRYELSAWINTSTICSARVGCDLCTSIKRRSRSIPFCSPGGAAARAAADNDRRDPLSVGRFSPPQGFTTSLSPEHGPLEMGRFCPLWRMTREVKSASALVATQAGEAQCLAPFKNGTLFSTLQGTFSPSGVTQ